MYEPSILSTGRWSPKFASDLKDHKFLFGLDQGWFFFFGTGLDQGLERRRPTLAVNPYQPGRLFQYSHHFRVLN